MDELVGLLTRERLLLDRVLFRATELRLVLGSDARFISWAAADLTKASDALRDAELQRAVAWAAFAADNGHGDDDFDWDLLLEVSEEPYTTIIGDLHESLSASATELRAQLDVIRQLGEAGVSGVSDMLARLANPAEIAKATAAMGPGSQWQPAAGQSRIDRTL